MFKKFIISVSALGILFCAAGNSFGMDAAYFRYNSGEEWEKAERVAEHADIVVRPDSGGELVFWRGSSYLPCWKTGSGKVYLEELVARSGDGPKERPDSINRFSRVRLIEDTAARSVVHWRYIADFSKKDFSDFTDEYFTVYPDGRCVRIVRRGTDKIDDWNDPSKLIRQSLMLSKEGVSKLDDSKPAAFSFAGSSMGNFENEGFDQSKGSYVLKCRKNSSPSMLDFKLTGGKSNEVVNPAVVVKNWGDADVLVKVNGKSFSGYKRGYINRANGIDMVIWLKVDTNEVVNVSIKPIGGGTFSNKAPEVNAGHDQTVGVAADSSGPYSVELSSRVDDDGLPADTMTLSWSKVSGPGSVRFSDEFKLNTVAEFSDAGTYQLRLTAKDGQLSGSDDVLIVIKKEAAGVVEPAAWWKFDEDSGDVAVESVSSVGDVIVGNKTLRAAGVRGRALVGDGYNTVVVHPAGSAPAVGGNLTLEGWIAIKAYPWNWCPIVHQSDWQSAGYFLGVDAYGHVGMKVQAGGKWIEVTSSSVVKRNKWYHIAGSYDSSSGKMKVYINGREDGSISVPNSDIEVSKADIKLGKGADMLPTDRIRENVGGTPDSFAFDGLIDEVKLYTKSLSGSEILDSYNRNKPDQLQVNNPDIQPRVLPAGSSEKADRFGAYYQTLKFYDTWDNMWRLSGDADVVIQFDEVPFRFVFWHGTSYVPNWVSERNKWSGSEFLETAKGGIEGCGEPMSDKKCRHSAVHIIENNDARVVIHWRYGMPDVHDKFAYLDSYGWGDWGQEYHYIYPDGTAIRRQTLWSSALKRWHEWQEAIVVNGPETRPEDNIEFDAVHMANLKGEKEVYTWEHGLPKQLHGEDMRYPEGANIHLVNLKSDWDHFSIFEKRALKKEPECYNGELTKASHFPWWNHWPVSQVTSDGRWSFEPDRTSHSSFDNFKWRPTYETENSSTQILYQGMIDKDVLSLVPLAKAWENPPAVSISSSGFSGGEFVRGERAYHLSRTSDSADVLEFTMPGSEESPVINPCFVIKRWDASWLSLEVDGKKVRHGKDFRYGAEVDSEGVSTQVVWVKMSVEKGVTFKISAK